MKPKSKYFFQAAGASKHCIWNGLGTDVQHMDREEDLKRHPPDQELPSVCRRESEHVPFM